MKSVKVVNCIILTFIFLLSLSSSISADQTATTGNVNRGFMPNDIWSTAREVGMGGSPVHAGRGTSVANSPASLGLSFWGSFYLTSMPQRTKVYNFSQLILADGFGYSLSQYRPEREGRFDVAFGLNYTYTKTLFGSMEETTEEFPDGTGRTFDPKIVTHLITVGIGIKYYGELGIGYSHKFIRHTIFEVKANGSAGDLGIIAKLPLSNLMPEKLSFDIGLPKRVTFDIEQIFAWTKYDINGSISTNSPAFDRNLDGRSVSAASAYDLPVLTSKVFSISGEAKHGNGSLLSLTMVKSSKSYEAQAEGHKQHGFEVGLGGIAYLRSGSYSSDINTSGYGFSVRGILDWLLPESSTTGSMDLGKYILKHVDFKYDVAHLGSGNSKLKYTSWSFTL